MNAAATRVVALFVLAASACCAASPEAFAQSGGAAAQGSASPARARDLYRVSLKLDFDRRAYSGTQRVRWVNRDARPASALFFHLYPNHRVRPEPNGGNPDARAPAPTAATSDVPAPQNAGPDEPQLEVTGVRAAESNQALPFTLDEGRVTMRVQTRESVAPGASIEVDISFRGQVPEIDADQTSLPAHVMQQVGAALRDAREYRRARDTNFSARGVTLLGAPFPLLAARAGDDWQRKVEPGVGDLVFTEPADYEVTVEAPADVSLYASGEERGGVTDEVKAAEGAATAGAKKTAARRFAGENLRGFALLAGRGLRSAGRQVSGVRVRSVYVAEHERVGQRVLDAASRAVSVFHARFGPLPFASVTVAEAPLAAGIGSAEFAGLGVVASAFYVDFDAPATRNLPDLVREQRASVEDSLEFASAHMVAHQWWGAAVGSDPQRAPVLDEALAHFSALLYYEEAHGAARAAEARDDQLRGVYQVYRTFGGEDLEAGAPARAFRNSFQYAAIVSAKGALMLDALRRHLGEARFHTALRRYYEANRLETAGARDLEAAFVAEVTVAERRALTRLFNRWLSEKRGDEDIAPPNPQLAAALGLHVEPANPRDRANAFSRLGRFFWRQMTRIR